MFSRKILMSYINMTDLIRLRHDKITAEMCIKTNNAIKETHAILNFKTVSAVDQDTPDLLLISELVPLISVLPRRKTRSPGNTRMHAADCYEQL